MGRSADEDRGLLSLALRKAAGTLRVPSASVNAAGFSKFRHTACAYYLGRGACSEKGGIGAVGPRRGWGGAPGRFLIIAAVLSLLFGAAHLLGLRTYTSLLSGTGPLGTLPCLLGAAYLVLYASFVILVPTLMIAAALVKGTELLSRAWRRASTGSKPARAGEGAG